MDELFRVAPTTAVHRTVAVKTSARDLSLEFTLGETRGLGISFDGAKWQARRSVLCDDGSWFHTFLTRPIAGGAAWASGFPSFSDLRPALMPWLEDEFGALESELVAEDILHLLQCARARQARVPAALPISTYFTVRTS